MCQECQERLMSANVGDRRLRETGKLLLVGSCIGARYPEVLDNMRRADGGQSVLHVCFEETHVNQAGFKIGSIVRYAEIGHLTALTADGSPHCIQLHFVIEDIKRHFTPEVETKHYVIEKGKVHEVSSEAVKQARHLSKIQSMLRERK